MLAQRAKRRCVARGAVRGGLQHLLAAQGHRAPGPEGLFYALVRAALYAGYSACSGEGGEEKRCEQVGLGGWVNFAGPTQYVPQRPDQWKTGMLFRYFETRDGYHFLRGFNNEADFQVFNQ